MNKITKIENYLDKIIPNPVCELEYQKDYELLIAIVLSAQTTDKRVNEVTKILFNKYKSLNELKDANLEDLEKIIRIIGTYKKKAIFIKEIATILVDKYNSIVPIEDNKLLEMPGVGRKTINVFLSEFYKIPRIAVDTHVERVSKRLKIANKDDNVEIVELKLTKKIKKENWSRFHHQLVMFGRYYCKAIKPNCIDCELKEICIEKKKNLN
ncbi:MAG: endonuclease III [Bacilli bacterium]|nr:endonuclease III [Bacilli bacterium]